MNIEEKEIEKKMNCLNKGLGEKEEIRNKRNKCMKEGARERKEGKKKRHKTQIKLQNKTTK